MRCGLTASPIPSTTRTRFDERPVGRHGHAPTAEHASQGGRREDGHEPAYTLHAEDDDYGQANTLANQVMDDAGRDRLVDNVASALMGIRREDVLARAFELLARHRRGHWRQNRSGRPRTTTADLSAAGMLSQTFFSDTVAPPSDPLEAGRSWQPFGATRRSLVRASRAQWTIRRRWTKPVFDASARELVDMTADPRSPHRRRTDRRGPARLQVGGHPGRGCRTDPPHPTQ